MVGTPLGYGDEVPAALVVRAGVTPSLVLLVIGTVAVVVLGVVADVVHHHVRPHDGIRAALRLNGESNLAAWWNAMLLLTGGGLAGVATLQARAHGRPRAEVVGWLAVAATLTALSVDEAVQLHERLALVAPHLPETGTYQWVVPGLAIAAVGLLGLTWAVRSLPGGVRRGLGGAAVLYLVGAVGVEGANGWITRRYGVGDLYRASTALEESLEMAGCLLAIAALATGLHRLGPVTLPPVRATVVWVASVWATVVVVSTAVALLARVAVGSPYAYHVYLWREGGTAAWVQAGIWWSAAWLFLLAARQEPATRRPLVVVAAVTGLVSASELGRIHELVGRVAVPPGGVWGEARWVPVAVALAAVVAALLLRARALLPPGLGERLALAVVLLGVGAVAGDLADERLAAAGDVAGRMAAAAASETLEVAAGLLVLACALTLARRTAAAAPESWAGDAGHPPRATMGGAGHRGPAQPDHPSTPLPRRSAP